MALEEEEKICTRKMCSLSWEYKENSTSGETMGEILSWSRTGNLFCCSNKINSLATWRLFQGVVLTSCLPVPVVASVLPAGASARSAREKKPAGSCDLSLEQADDQHRQGWAHLALTVSAFRQWKKWKWMRFSASMTFTEPNERLKGK